MIWALAKQWKMKVNKGPLVYKLVMIVLQLLQGLGRRYDIHQRQNGDCDLKIDWTWKSHPLQPANII